METNYKALGRAAMERFQHTTAHAVELQHSLLAQLLEENRDTELGRRLGFAELGSVEDYQSRVPLSSYEDYAPAIRRMLDGERGLLTREDPVYFCISSGSTDRPKYLPVVRRDLETHYVYAYGGVFGMIEAYYGWPEEELFSRIFQVGEFVKTSLPDGTLSGVRSSSLYQWLDRDGSFDASAYCVPKEVLFPTELVELNYVRARFALAEPEIRMVFGVFVHRLVGTMRYMEENWDMLLWDMAHGCVSPAAGLSPAWADYLREKLPPAPERAAELSRLERSALRHGMVKKLWPAVKSVTAIGGSSFVGYMQQLADYCGDVPFYPFAYAASEGIFAIAPGVGRMDEYVLLPDGGFFEFLPEDGGRVCTMEQVEQGRRYELVITNFSGLYRYRMEDVVEVVGRYGESPVLRFCCRKNQVINVADERTNLEQFEAAVASYCRLTGVPYSDNHCLFADFSTSPPRYCVCLEEHPLHPPDADQVFDWCMCRANFGYQGCRTMGEVGCVRVNPVPKQQFSRYEHSLLRSGRPLSQIKPLRIILTEEGRKLFSESCRGDTET